MRRKVKQKAIFKTPLGWTGVAVSEKGVFRIVLPKKEKRTVKRELANANVRLTPVLSSEGSGEEKRLEKAVKLLQQYFSGKSVPFDLQLDLRYYTPFQKRVWRAASTIPYSETRSYGWIAKQIGKPKASRAVGQAMGANPIPVFIP